MKEPCKFYLAWRGPCGEENCKEHAHLRCCSCGAPATEECDQTVGPAVCGASLCAECHHLPALPGEHLSFRHGPKKVEAASPVSETLVPPPIGEAYKLNFETLKCASQAGNLALVSAVRLEDKKPVVLVCAVSASFQITPLAVMIDGNPYEMFRDPTL